MKSELRGARGEGLVTAAVTLALVGLLGLIVVQGAKPRAAAAGPPAVRDNPNSCEVRPPLGHTVACRVAAVIDGDTIEVEVVRRVRVRLLSCWAPETRTLDEREKEQGLEAKAALSALALGRDATLFVPTADAPRLGDVWSFDRVLGHVWLDGDRETLSAHQVGRRLASTRKGGELGE